jgi:WD40 repeat protein
LVRLMADVFLSYSRRDTDFVRGLVADLEARGKSVWVDTEGISDGEVFPDAIRSAIEGSDSFVFVITPESAASAYCEQEVEHALALNKRVVPVLREPVPDEALPEAIRVRNWVPYTPDADANAASDRLVAALDTDLEHVHAHTYWLVKALAWDAKGRDKSLLVRGSELASAEAWLAGIGDRTEPAATALQREYVYASRNASSRRQRTLLAVAGTVAAVSVGLVVFALISRNQAVSAKANAQSRALAAESATQLSVDPERSLLLAMAAEHSRKTPEATYALRRAIDLSPIRGRLPNVGPQPQGVMGWGPGVAYSHDGKQIAEGSQSGKVVLVDARTMRVQRTVIAGKWAPVVAYSPDGSTLAVGTEKGVVLLDPATGARLGTIGAITSAGRLNFSPDGKLLSAIEYDPFTFDAHLEVADMATRRVRVIPVGPVLSKIKWGLTQGAEFSPDGRRVLVTSQNGLGVFDVASGRLLATTGVGQEFNHAEYSPDGAQIVAAVNPYLTGAAGDNAVVLLDARTLKKRATVFRSARQFEFAYQARFSPDGTRIGFVVAHTFGVYSVATGRLVYRSDLGTTFLSQVAFAPNGHEIAVGALDGSGAVYRADGIEKTVIDAGPIDPNLGEIPLALTADQVVAAFSPTTGPNAGGEIVQRWSTSGKAAAPPLVVNRAVCPWFGVAPDGVQAYSAPGDCVGLSEAQATKPYPVSIWDIAARKIVKDPQSTGITVGLASFSGDVSRMAAIVRVHTDDPNRQANAIDLIDLKTGKGALLKALATCQRSTFSWPTLSRDGSTVVGKECGDHLVTFRVGPTGAVRHRIPGSVSNSAGPLALSPDAKSLAIGNATGASDVEIVDATSGRTLVTLSGHTRPIGQIAYSPDGSMIATGSSDGTVRIWDPATGRLLLTLDHPAPIFGLAFGPDGRTIASMDTSGVIRLWDACADCRNPDALMALAKTRVTRELTPNEQDTYVK